MANKRISDLPAATNVTTGDVLPIDGTTTRKITHEDFLKENLLAIKGLDSAADKVPYFTGAGTAGLADFTSFGRSLFDDGDAAEARATLELGTAAQSDNTDFASAAQGGLADSAVQPSRAIGAGTGLTGGGNLSADRTIALDTASQASLALADSAVQPGDLGALATKDQISVPGDISATGTPSASTYLRGDGAWAEAAGGAGGSVSHFETRDDAIAATIAADTFVIDRYNDGYPRAPAPYKRGVSLPAAFQDASGAWFGLDIERTTIVDPRWFGVKGDGIFSTNGVVSGAGRTTFSSVSVGFTAADVGKLIKIAGVGTAGATHITTIASINSPTSCELAAAAASTGSSKNFTYGTNDQTALIAARDFCWANGTPTLAFQDGRYCYNGNLELARENWSVAALGSDVWLESFRTTSGNALSLNGSARNPSGVYEFYFGGAFPINVRGNSNCSNGIYINGLVKGGIRARSRDSQVGILTDNAGSTPAVGCVSTYLDLGVCKDDISFFDFTPSIGLYLAFVYSSWGTLQAEDCGTSSTTPAIRLTASNGNVFTGGTAQSNFFGGVLVTATAHRNTFIGMHNEYNGAAPDWQIDGNHNVFIACAGAGTADALATAANVVSGDYNQFISGEFWDMQLQASADYNTFRGADLSHGTITDNSLTTTFEGCPGATDKAPPPVVGALSLTGGFTNTSTPYRNSSYFRTRAGEVQVEGVVTCGTVSGATTIGTLPVGYRPSASIPYAAANLTTNAGCGLIINSSGQVQTRYGIATGDIVSITSPPFRPA